MLDHGEIFIGDTTEVESVIKIEHEKQIKALEKQFEHDQEYVDMKEFLSNKPDMKEEFLRNLAIKRLNKSPILERPLVNEHSTTTSQYNMKMNKEFSDIKSTLTKGSYYSASVRNGRYKSDLDESGKKEYQKNLKVIKRLQNEKKKREQVIQYLDNKKLLKDKEQEELKLEAERVKSEERKREMEEWREKMQLKTQERKELRKKILKDSEIKLQELRTIEPLHEKYEKKYMDEFELPELERRQKILSDIAANNRSDFQSINQHSVEYNVIRKQKLEERMKKRMDQIKSYSNYSVSQHRTKTFEMMSMRDEMQASLEEEKRQERLRLIQNTKHYAKNVLDLHKPPISKKKQEEMKALIEDMHKSPQQKVARIKYERSDNSILNDGVTRSVNGRISRMKPDEDSKYLSNLSNLYKADESIGASDKVRKQDLNDGSINGDELDMVPEKVAKYESALNPSGDYYNGTRSKSNIKGKKNKQIKRRIMNNSIDNARHNILKVDYLTEKRQQRMEDGGYQYKETEFWKKDLEGTGKTTLEKYHEIMQKANNLERKAQLKEELIMKSSANDVVKDSEQLSGMYMDAIRAKAALLSNL